MKKHNVIITLVIILIGIVGWQVVRDVNDQNTNGIDNEGLNDMLETKEDDFVHSLEEMIRIQQEYIRILDESDENYQEAVDTLEELEQLLEDVELEE